MREKKEKKKKKYPRPHIQVQRGLAVQIMNLGLFNEFEFVNGEKIPIIYNYNLSEIMRSLNYDPAVFIPKLLKNGYLVIKDFSLESYYLFTSKKKGLEFKKTLNKWP